MRSKLSKLDSIRLTLVAPSAYHAPSQFKDIRSARWRYAEVIHEIQRFRGHVYLQDRAIPSQALDAEGRHFLESDYKSWHIVLRDRRDRICGIIKVGIFPHRHGSVKIEGLQVHRVISRMHSDIQPQFATAVREFICKSRDRHPHFIEPSGFAIKADSRKAGLAPILAASIWSLARVLGGATGVGAATGRHRCAEILRRMGGFELVDGSTVLPPFYDSFHGCDMEIIGFESDYLCPKLEPMVSDIQDYITHVPIITR